MNDIKGKTVFLLCSAPGASIDRVKQCELFCTVNGAIIPFRLHVPTPDYWFINSCTLIGGSVAAQKTRPLIKDASCRNMVFVDACKGDGDNVEFFSNTPDNDLFFYTRDQRCEWIEENTGFKLSGTGGQNVPSMGAFALAWLLNSGAKKIVVSGMSFNEKGGHSYLPGESTKRGHLDIDIAFIRNLDGFGRVEFI